MLAEDDLQAEEEKMDKFIQDELGLYYDTKLILYNNADPSTRKYQIYKKSKEKTDETNQITANAKKIKSNKKEKQEIEDKYKQEETISIYLYYLKPNFLTMWIMLLTL
ncbi:MAG: hypothetical protein AB3N34_01225 [Lettuce witches'-broom phytoplasma]